MNAELQALHGEHDVFGFIKNARSQWAYTYAVCLIAKKLKGL